MKKDLEKRTLDFSITITKLCTNKKWDYNLAPILKQLIRSATSVGSNYRESQGSPTKKDFCYKISLCLKEIKETEYWLQILDNQEVKPESLKNIINESIELVKIFTTISKNAKKE